MSNVSTTSLLVTAFGLLAANLAFSGQGSAAQAASAKQEGGDAQLRILMDRLGIQQVEAAEEKHFVQRGAPRRDRDRLPQAKRIQPPDAFHSAPTVVRKLIDDATRRQYARAAGAGRGGRGYYGYGRADRFGTLGRISGPYESYEGSMGYVPSSAMNQSGSFGAGWSNTAMGNSNFPSYGYGIGSSGIGSVSSSRLLQGGSPSDLGSQAGSPSSIYTIGSGNTLSGSGAMPGGGLGTGTGAGTFGINGPMGAAGT